VATSSSGRPRQAVIDPVAGFTKAAVSQWSQARLAPGCQVYSDGTSAFALLAEHGHRHTVLPGKRRQATEQPHSRWVNVVLSNLKRSLDGAYHAFAFGKYAHRYLAETAWRFNRRWDLTQLVPGLLAATVSLPPWTERALRDVPVFHAERSC